MVVRTQPNAERAPEALIEAVAASRDKSAFQELFVYFAPRIKAYLRRLGMDEAAADEMSQEAMLTLWRKAHLFDRRKAKASTWVFTIARNLRIDRIRRERRPSIDPEDPAIAGEPPSTGEELVDSAQIGERVRAALSGLPADQARVIEMAFFEEKTHTMIAAELDLPLGTVKSRLRLAFGRIRSVLVAEEGGEK